MEANTNKIPVFSTLFFGLIIFIVGFMFNVMIIPSCMAPSEEIFWIYSIPTAVLMINAIVFSVFFENEKVVGICGSTGLTLSFIMMIMGSSFLTLVFSLGIVPWLIRFFAANPICHKQMKKWLKGIVSEEQIEKA